MIKLKKHNKYAFTWFDIDHDNTWIGFDEIEEELKKLGTIESIGYLVKQTSKYLVFTSGIDFVNKNYFDKVVLPKGVIVSIREIK